MQSIFLVLGEHLLKNRMLDFDDRDDTSPSFHWAISSHALEREHKKAGEIWVGGVHCS